MADLTPGIYERLITNDLQLRLAALDDTLVDRGRLDAADGYEVLSRHLSNLIRRALRSVSGDDAVALARQVDLANEVAQAIMAIAPDVASDTDLVSETRD